MFKLGFSNLRRLHDVPPIEIKRINVLLGRNSSGKSTFIRLLPLLKQSIKTRTSSPILWYGDYVDFGSFPKAVAKNDTTANIILKFSVDNVDLDRRSFYFEGATRQGAQTVEVSIYLSYDDKTAYISRFSLRCRKLRYNFNVSVDKNDQITSVSLNERDITEIYKYIKISIQHGEIFPDLIMVSRSAEDPFYPFVDETPLVQNIAAVLKVKETRSEQRFDAYFLANYLLSLPSFNITNVKRALQEMPARRKIPEATIRENFSELKKIYDANNLFVLSNATFSRLRDIISETLYIGPARARSERYYRHQDLAVSEIDPDGKNFPMFLRSLAPAQIRSFSRWVERRFGYGITISSDEGHISINLTADKRETNIVDTGYGVSQVLPVLAQIWWASNRPSSLERGNARAAPSILLIEQPELHLHPAHQALLADCLIDEATKRSKGNTGPVHLVVETHSEAFVNRLGELIASKRLLANDVQILLFEADPSVPLRTNVTVSGFHEDGSIDNWPYGFFQPDVD